MSRMLLLHVEHGHADQPVSWAGRSWANPRKPRPPAASTTLKGAH